MYSEYYIETDLGRDPDDMIAILWLLAQPNIHINTIFITPGDIDQVAIANFIREKCNHDFYIVVPEVNRKERCDKRSSGGAHYELLKKYGAPLEGASDTDVAINPKLLPRVLSIGPLTNIYTHFSSITHPIMDITIQGGFVPYSVYTPSIVLEKFNGLEMCQSFNFGADLLAFDWASKHFTNATYVSKNLCHTFDSFLTDFNKKPTTIAGEILYNFVSIYFKKHKNKRLHDVIPTMYSTGLFNNSCIKINGTPIRNGNKFGWKNIGSNTNIVDINYEDFYSALLGV